MSGVTQDEVRVVVAEFLTRQSRGGEAFKAEDLTDDCDLLLSGMIDSLGLLDLVAALQEKFGEDIDFEELDPEDMTIMGPLSAFIAERATAR